MKNEATNTTATERIFKIQQELTRIRTLIDHARLPLEIVEDGMDYDASMEKVDHDLHSQIMNLADVIRDLDSLRIDLMTGTQELIA